ncbi:Variant surface glycoprotein [Trypanosoma congolense IL3000]|uniref:Variant surface glycoprotein n=1 Tax=Trypanosoma congolense (strain IL3000) TaxID=1068625 RepID=F9WJQ1_TRYCI|nr:Variant surface glycoprotein [Trypanosoma congolense IL3000]
MLRSLLFLAFLMNTWSAANDYNKDVFDKLCEIKKKTMALFNAHQDHSQINKSLYEAIYGSEESARFDDNGDVKFGGACSLTAHGRSEVCNYKTGNSGSSGKNGCFADSLFGTFLCLCTPGSGDAGTLCGFGKVGDGAVWSGFAGVGHEKVLFSKVLEKVKEQCTGELPNVLNNDNKLNNLITAIEAVTGRLKEIGGYLYLGDGRGVCSGINRNEVCVAYKKVSGKNEADIPWVKRIYKVLEDLQKVIHQRTEHKNSKTEPKTYSQLGNSVENVDHKENSDNITDKNDEKSEDTEEKTNTVKSQSISREDLQRRKRRIQKSTETNIASLATDTNEDGSIQTNPKWPFLTTLFI